MNVMDGPPSALEAKFLLLVAAHGLPEPAREYRFCPPRRFRFDAAWVPQRVAAELEGGVFSHGRHVTGVGFTQDCIKYNLATQLGWRVLRFTSAMLDEADALDGLAIMLNGEERNTW